MGWLITGAVLVLLSLLPLGVRAEYGTSGAVVWITVGPAKLCLYPKTRKQKSSKKSAETSGTGFEREKTLKKGGSYTDFVPIVQDILDLLISFRRKIRVKQLELRLVMANNDPCNLAINYGRAWTALGNLMPQLERLFIIRKRDLEVQCDFTANETLVYAQIDISITLGRLLYIALLHGTRIFRKYLKILNQRKGGAKL